MVFIHTGQPTRRLNDPPLAVLLSLLFICLFCFFKFSIKIRMEHCKASLDFHLHDKRKVPSEPLLPVLTNISPLCPVRPWTSLTPIHILGDTGIYSHATIYPSVSLPTIFMQTQLSALSPNLTSAFYIRKRSKIILALPGEGGMQCRLGAIQKEDNRPQQIQKRPLDSWPPVEISKHRCGKARWRPAGCW